MLIDIFQFSNTYAINKNATLLLHASSLQTECVNFVSRSGTLNDTVFISIDKQRLPFATLFTLYCSLKSGVTLRQWMEENARVIPFLDLRYVPVALAKHALGSSSSLVSLRVSFIDFIGIQSIRMGKYTSRRNPILDTKFSIA